MRSYCLFPALLVSSAFVLCHCNGSGLRTATTVLASPALVDFGDVPVGKSRGLEVSLSISGPGQVNLTGTSIDGPSVFTVSPAPTSSVTSKDPGTVTVTFQPTDVGEFAGVLHVANTSRDTPDLSVHLRGQGVPFVPDAGMPDAGLSDAGPPPLCSGYTGSPSTNIIQVPVTANANTVTVTCPDSSVLIGCGFLCDDGKKPGGTEMLDEKSCRADCQNATTISATAFCYRGDPTCVTQVQMTNVSRGTTVTCPDDHPQLLGCTSRCVNATTQNNNSGTYVSSDGHGCTGACDLADDTIPQLVAYCGAFPKQYSQVTQSGLTSGGAAVCPDQTTVVGGVGLCNIVKTGGFIANDSNGYAGYCADMNVAEITAFCVAN